MSSNVVGLFVDKPAHVILFAGRRRRVYKRYDWKGNFVRWVVKRTAAERNKLQKEYGPSVNIQTWDAVPEHML